MAYRFICNANRDREAWLEARRGFIGASDAAGILNLSPWASPMTVYADKIAVSSEEEPEPEHFAWARLFEPLIAREAALELGLTLLGRGGDMYASEERPWQAATVDEMVSDAAGSEMPLEIKMVSARMDEWEAEVPPYYRVQVQHQIAVSGAPRGFIAALMRGQRLVLASVDRDDRFIDEVLHPAEAAFWRLVEERRPPELEGRAFELEALRRLYPRDTGDEIVLEDSRWMEIADRMQAISAAARALDDEKKDLQARILRALGDATVAFLPDGRRFSARLVHNDGYVVKPFDSRPIRVLKGKRSGR